MRCTNCRSYIPAGLESKNLNEPVKCPLCGAAAAAPAPTPQVTATSTPSTIVNISPAAETAPPPLPQSEKNAAAVFAPYFTIQTVLSFGPTTLNATASRGSLSFGPAGFSIVWDRGHHWEKVHYRDLTETRLEAESVVITVRDLESRISIYHPWLPRWIKGARRKRAEKFVELLSRVKRGLTPTEIAGFQRALG